MVAMRMYAWNAESDRQTQWKKVRKIENRMGEREAERGEKLL